MARRWVHVIVNTHGSWLPGDERGFRNRGHRIHSSGDYKHRPPVREQEGLRKYHLQRASDAISFNREIRICVLRAFVIKMQSLKYHMIAGSVGKEHLHALCELPEDYRAMRREVGKCKQYASHQAREMLPGAIWSGGGDYEAIRDKGHLHNAYNYIRTKQEPGTVVWSHRDDEDWINDPKVGMVVMEKNGGRIRVFIPMNRDSDAGV